MMIETADTINLPSVVPKRRHRNIALQLIFVEKPEREGATATDITQYNSITDNLIRPLQATSYNSGHYGGRWT